MSEDKYLLTNTDLTENVLQYSGDGCLPDKDLQNSPGIDCLTPTMQWTEHDTE